MLSKTLFGPSDLWPVGSVWNYHAGKPKSVFDNIHWFTDGVNNRYGTTSSAADYARKAELQNYENTRAFFEAWSAHELTQSFGTIFWMLNGVWPSVHWNLYDWYYEPGGGYFGAKKADEPVHIAYDYATRNVYVVNSTLTARSGMSATATFYNIPGITTQSTTSASSLSIPANASTQVMTLPAVSGLSTATGPDAVTHAFRVALIIAAVLAAAAAPLAIVSSSSRPGVRR